MPLYEYHCSKCDKNFEVLQRFSDAPIATHEECGGRVERVLSAPAFQFKGSGWYVTDYGKGGNKPGTLSDHAAAEKKAGDSEKKSGEADKKSTDAKANDSKASDSKASDSKSSDSKSTETKSESKPESKSESKSDTKPASESKAPAKTD
jgi:putative FmdB family regulatory protein